MDGRELESRQPKLATDERFRDDPARVPHKPLIKKVAAEAPSHEQTAPLGKV